MHCYPAFFLEIIKNIFLRVVSVFNFIQVKFLYVQFIVPISNEELSCNKGLLQHVQPITAESLIAATVRSNAKWKLLEGGRNLGVYKMFTKSYPRRILCPYM